MFFRTNINCTAFELVNDGGTIKSKIALQIVDFSLTEVRYFQRTINTQSSNLDGAIEITSIDADFTETFEGGAFKNVKLVNLNVVVLRFVVIIRIGGGGERARDNLQMTVVGSTGEFTNLSTFTRGTENRTRANAYTFRLDKRSFL